LIKSGDLGFSILDFGLAVNSRLGKSSAMLDLARAQNSKSEIENSRSAIVLFKLGGSLLTLPDLGRRARAALQQRPRCRPLMVVGGGAAAELVREWDRLHGLGDDVAHRLAIRAMNCTAFLAAAVIDGARTVSSIDEIATAWDSGELPVLLPEPLLAALESPADHLPPSWDVTSDSIAAWLALRLGAVELVLLKSTDLPTGGIGEAVRDCAVDRYFPTLAGAVARLTWVNLRASELRFMDCGRPGPVARGMDA
jgi:aspartokinase-like uncharacterized kinase